MDITTKFIKMQIEFFKFFVNGCTIETSRAAQEKMGSFMAGTHKSKVRYSTKVFKDFIGEWIIPKNQKNSAVVLYVHGGGYVSGSIDYAKGFGTILSIKNGMRIFCPAYRLAPENPFPAALYDVLEAYKYLIEYGYPPEKIILCGESAGGGLIFALALKLRELSLPLPCGVIAISPWTDLTLSGSSYKKNMQNDPSLTKERLSYYASLYSTDTKNPYVSPLFGDLTGLPPSLIFVGGDEILFDDSRLLHEKLIEYGSSSRLVVAPEMWHAYILYGIKEAQNDHIKISDFIGEILNDSAKSKMAATGQRSKDISRG